MPCFLAAPAKFKTERKCRNPCGVPGTRLSLVPGEMQIGAIYTDFHRTLRRISELEDLGGGEGRIRTPGTASTYLGGIQPDLGGLFRPNKSIIDGENMFALDSAVLRSSLLPWSARLTRGIWKRQTSDKGLGVRFSTSQAGSRPSAAQPYLRN
jgi:hypothetical protein